jgi:hypothetical protein
MVSRRRSPHFGQVITEARVARRRRRSHRDDYQELGGNEKLRFICADRAQPNKAAEQGEFREADRAGGGGDHRASAA